MKTFLFHVTLMIISASRDTNEKKSILRDTTHLQVLLSEPYVHAMSFLLYKSELPVMRKAMDLSWAQMVMAANAPMLLKAGLVDGNTNSGVLASGQVVGVLDDLPTCAELVDRIMIEADATLEALQ